MTTSIQADQLADAVNATDPVRHGRAATRSLTDDDIDALRALDNHVALSRLYSEVGDQRWVEGEAEDLLEQARAGDYLHHIDDLELDRRLNALPHEFVSPSDPQPIPAQECPVCWTDAIISTGDDAFGYGITAGICFVCSYRRTEHAAYEVNLQQEWDLRWSKD